MRRAIKDYNQALKINPNDGLAYNNRGVSYENKGRHSPFAQKKLLYKRALEDYDRALKIDPHSTRTPYNRARVLAQLQLFNK